MFSWAASAVKQATQSAQSALSTVAGTAEPIYGPEAFHSVALRAHENPTNEITKADLQWMVLDYTNVETQSFYFLSDGGHIGFAQVIYSNVLSVHVTVQFSVKIFYPKNADGTQRPPRWSSVTLTNPTFDEEKYCFYADNLAVELSPDGNVLTIKAMCDPEIAVDLTVTRVAPGFKIGPDAKSLYGTDVQNPWGFIRHIFWPRNKAVGSIVVNEEKVDFAGKALFIMAMQGMKPHHAAARWNFLNFHGPNYSAVMMEFTTPPSYGSSVVNVSGITSDSKLVLASTEGNSSFPETRLDPDTEWHEPTKLKYVWKGTDDKGNKVEATMEAPTGERLDRMDIMAEVPAFVKKIVAGTAGTRPYIYQYTGKHQLKVKIGNEPEIVEEGIMFAEASFIS